MGKLKNYDCHKQKYYVPQTKPKWSVLNLKQASKKIEKEKSAAKKQTLGKKAKAPIENEARRLMIRFLQRESNEAEITGAGGATASSRESDEVLTAVKGISAKVSDGFQHLQSSPKIMHAVATQTDLS